MTKVKVEGTCFVRDIENMSLINNNKGELEQYNLKRNIHLKQSQEIKDIKNEVSSMKEDISQIKELLIKMLDNKG